MFYNTVDGKHAGRCEPNVVYRAARDGLLVLGLVRLRRGSSPETHWRLSAGRLPVTRCEVSDFGVVDFSNIHASECPADQPQL